MALDTVSKRFSTIHLGSPWRGLLPIPDGALGQGDRQHVMFLSSAVLAGEAAAIVAGPYYTDASQSFVAGSEVGDYYAPGSIVGQGG